MHVNTLKNTLTILSIAFSVILTLLFIVCINPNTATAQQVNLSLSKDSILIGDQLFLTIEVRIPSDASIQSFPQLQDSIGKIEILAKTNLDSAKDQQVQIFQQRYTLTAFDSGYYEIPAQKLNFINEEGTQTILSNPAYLYVNTIPVDTAQDFKPIFEIEEEDAPSWWTVVKDHILEYKYYYIIVFIVLIALGIGIFFLIKYLNNKKKAPKKTVQEIPFIKAQRRIQELINSNIWNEGNYKEYASILSDIIKDYIEESYALPANEMTTRDLLHTVKKSKELRTIHQELRTVLQLTDLIKFAKHLPIQEDKESLERLANKIVDATKPKSSQVS